MSSTPIDDVVKDLLGSLPESLKQMEQDVSKQFHEILQAGLAKMDLVPRSEFDAQVKVLARTRSKLTAMEKQLAAIEAQVLGKEPSNDTSSGSQPSEGGD